MKTQPATGETYPKSDLFNKAVTIGKTSHRCYVTKAAEPKLYRLIPLGGGSTVSDAICAGANPTLASKTCDALSQKAGRC
ncbi:hypothetical protein NGE66_18045 [Klebsiella pneumoniae]|nr:hypothetical protein [Klebsiella pneumoniae]